MSADANLEKYESHAVVSFYEHQTELQPCEQHLFSRHIKPGCVILDMGVGGGRTTPYLAKSSIRYVGADYSKAMIEACRKRFPALEYRHCDATDMGQFGDGEFDAVVFSFNGIDEISSDEARAACLSEIARVLKPGGLFIFSSHNARCVGVWPLLTSARGYQVPWRILRSVIKSARIAVRNLSQMVFSRGEGYIHDPVHGGMCHYVSTPTTMSPQLEEAGFGIVEIVGGHFPEVTSTYLTPWFYYVATKRGVS